MADLLFDALVIGSDIVFDALDGPLGVAGAGVTDTATAPTGVAGQPATASGAGSTATASAPTGSGAIPATGAGVSDTASAPSAIVESYKFVTLVDPIDTSPGSIAFPGNFIGTPKAGDVIRFETRNGFQVLPDGTVLAGFSTL